MTHKGSSGSRLRKLAFVAMAALTGAVLVGAQPAQAADSAARLQTNRYENTGLCLLSPGVGKAPTENGSCVAAATLWLYQPRSTGPSGHALVKFQNAHDHGCIDAVDAAAGGAAKDVACNTGDNQLWEVFSVKVGSKTYYQYKSYGEFTRKGRHLCLESSSHVELTTCASGNTGQQWNKIPNA